MASSIINNNRLFPAMERTGQWVFSQDVPTDVIVEVGITTFNLHKFMLVAKSNYIRQIIFDSEDPNMARIDLSDIPGGPEIFEKAAKFCYGVNFEITVHNVAALRCAAEYLQMTDKYSDGNLASRTEDFMSQVALSSLSGALVVLKSCEDLLPLAEDLGIVKRCIDSASAKVCNETSFPSQTPPNWWSEELTILDISFFGKIIAALKARGAKNLTLATAILAYAEKSLGYLVQDHPRNGAMSLDPSERSRQRDVLESIVSLMPAEKTIFPINFLCCLLQTAIHLKATNATKNELERRISVVLEHATVDNLLILSFSYEGKGLMDLESVRKIISGFVEKEKSIAAFSPGDFGEVCSTAMPIVAKLVDAYLGEIGTCEGLSILKFNGIANLVPKGVRKMDDDLYRAIDIYLKAHPDLDEIEREKVCSCMDPLNLSPNARVHASQNKRLPVQVVLHALYYDQLKIRSGVEGHAVPNAVAPKSQLQTDVTLVRENAALRDELTKMKMYITDMQKSHGTPHTLIGGSASCSRKPTFFSSMSKKFGKLNPFKNGSKDMLNIEEDAVDLTKPRRRRFSVS